jgi:hypothetical protein
MPFIHDDFLLANATARRLYHEYAAPEPILDYHCHLPPKDVAENRRFRNLFEIWLEGDHYKWRAMRANGVDERFCTGDADPWDKFLAWARTVPATLRNPLYHWTHLELKRYFGIEELLDESTARRVWDQALACGPKSFPPSVPTKRSTSTCPKPSTAGWIVSPRRPMSTSGISPRSRTRSANGTTISIRSAAGSPITAWTTASRVSVRTIRPTASSSARVPDARPRLRSASSSPRG